LGKISFPVYAIHLPAYQLTQYLYDLTCGLSVAAPLPVGVAGFLSVGVIGASYFLARVYDEPVRNKLVGALIQRKSSKIASTLTALAHRMVQTRRQLQLGLGGHLQTAPSVAVAAFERDDLDGARGRLQQHGSCGESLSSARDC
jgi:hypothetical protein